MIRGIILILLYDKGYKDIFKQCFKFSAMLCVLLLMCWGQGLRWGSS